MKILYIQLLISILCTKKQPTNTTNMKSIPIQAIYDANEWPYEQNLSLDQGMNTQVKIIYSKPITNLNDKFLAKDCIEINVSNYKNHVYQQEKTETDSNNFYSEQKLGKKPEFTNYYPYREPCLEGIQLFQKDEENINRDSCDLNNTQSESVYDKTKVWTFLKSNDLKDSSCVVSSIKNPLPTQFIAPKFDVENVLNFNYMQGTISPYPTAPNMYENNEKSHRDMDPYSCPYPPSLNTNTNNTIGSKFMPFNPYLHQPTGLNDGLNDIVQFNNTHVKQTPYPPAYNENINCNAKNVNIRDGICPYPTNSAENTRAMPQPITNNTNNQRNVLGDINNTANIKPDMLSNLISPQKIVSPSIPLNDLYIAKENQGSSNIRSVNQNSHAETNFNFNDMKNTRFQKYEENIPHSFLCQNQDIDKRNTCPYPIENNIYTDVLLSPTNNLSNPMPIHQINSKHEILKNLNSPNCSSHITFENKLVNINQEDKKKDTILNAPKNSQKILVESCVHLTVDGGDKTQQKTNTDATSNIQYGIREKSPINSRANIQQEIKNERTRTRYEAKKINKKKSDSDEKKQLLMKVSTSFVHLENDSLYQIPINNNNDLLNKKTNCNSTELVICDELKNDKSDEIMRDYNNQKKDDKETDSHVIVDDSHEKTILYNDKPKHDSCLIQFVKEGKKTKLDEEQLALESNSVGEEKDEYSAIASNNTQISKISPQTAVAEKFNPVDQNDNTMSKISIIESRNELPITSKNFKIPLEKIVDLKKISSDSFKKIGNELQTKKEIDFLIRNTNNSRKLHFLNNN